MILLGSCTMKLNAAAEMMLITWPEFAAIHPSCRLATGRLRENALRRVERAVGHHRPAQREHAAELRRNGEYAGLVTIRNYHASRGQDRRDVCLIPQSAHGTNPATAHMAGMRVVVVVCDPRGNVDVADLKAKVAANRDRPAVLMITYPSTHGVFEEAIRDICAAVHEGGGCLHGWRQLECHGRTRAPG